MHIEILDLIEGAKQARGLTVIIDVFRAFSTACYVVQNGASEIVPVGDVDLAYQLKEQNPDFFRSGGELGTGNGFRLLPEHRDMQFCLEIRKN
jgi:2-phosphosulfolactate phosphatase